MNSSSSKLVTWNIKKNKKLAAKKRKLEAFLKLVSTDEAVPAKQKKEEDSLAESYKTLKDELKKYVKKPNSDPSFYLTEIGLKAQVNFKYYNKDRCPGETISPLFIEDIYHLLLKSLIGHLSPYPMRWCKLENPKDISKTILLVVEGLSKWDIIQNISSLNNITDIFPSMVDIVSSNIPFATELSSLHLVSDFHIQVKDTYSSLFPIEKTSERTTEILKTPSKVHLLLSPIQLVMENYPLPQSVYTSSKSENYIFTKDSYLPVTENSPMFALDCEMCRTAKNPSELTRIAIVDESLETVYETLVKPDERIVDYMTKYSGITKEMLEGVT
ncbi:putative RNA exonuclease NEF-sp, partial [Stegodyphus mimosarum]